MVRSLSTRLSQSISSETLSSPAANSRSTVSNLMLGCIRRISRTMSCRLSWRLIYPSSSAPAKPSHDSFASGFDDNDDVWRAHCGAPANSSACTSSCPARRSAVPSRQSCLARRVYPSHQRAPEAPPAMVGSFHDENLVRPDLCCEPVHESVKTTLGSCSPSAWSDLWTHFSRAFWRRISSAGRARRPRRRVCASSVRLAAGINAAIP